MPQLTGGCLCERGALHDNGGTADYVRVPLSRLPEVHWQCLWCPCRPPKEAVTISGTMKTFTSLGGSGKPILRHFCPECGSSIAEEAGTAPSRVVLNVGTFDEPKAVAQARENFCDDALPWVHLTGDMQRYAKRPV
jgi:hypothetical protein